MIFFRYTRFLEKENAQLKTRIESVEARNQELVLALFNKVGVKVPDKPVPTPHKINKTESTATCTCGWNAICNDPVELQQKISEHYRQGVAPLGRTSSWPNARKALENQGEVEHGN